MHITNGPLVQWASGPKVSRNIFGQIGHQIKAYCSQIMDLYSYFNSFHQYSNFLYFLKLYFIL